MPAQDLKVATAELSKGGVWKDENLAESLDWAGETGSPAAAIDETKTHPQKTAQQIENEVLHESSLSPELIGIIANRVGKFLARTSGAENRTLVQMVDDKLKRVQDDVQAWIDTQSKRVSAVEEMTSKNNQSELKRLDEKIATLEFKIDAIAGGLTKHGPDEIRMIQEANKIIRERHSSDKDGDESVSEVSVVKRMANRVEELTDHLRKLEPIADSGIAALKQASTGRESIRRKFGRML